ncbi:hypothetical protein [Sinomonas atrocyanea]
MEEGAAPDAPREAARPADWDPRGTEVQKDQIAAYDAMRAVCPAALGAQGNWAVFGHADVRRILADPARFSNVVSTHLSVPNGMDPPTHTAFRAIVDRYYTPERMEAFEPVPRAVARRLLAALPRRTDVEVMGASPSPSRPRSNVPSWGGPRPFTAPCANGCARTGPRH